MNPRKLGIPDAIIASNDDDGHLNELLARLKGANNSGYEDEVIAAARAHDTMRDELYHAWSSNGKLGKNPDDLNREDVSSAYARMIEQQRAQQAANGKFRS